MRKKIYLFLKITTFILVVYLFLNFINQDEFIKTIKKIDLKMFILIFVTFLPLPFLMTVRWFIIVKNFSKISFLDFFRNIITGFSFSLISSSSLALDVTRLIKIKSELGTKKSLILVVFDKGFALFFKICFVIFLLNLLNIFYLSYHIKLFLLITLFIFLLLFLFFYNFNKIVDFLRDKKFLNFKFDELSRILILLKDKFFLLLFVNFIIQSLNILLYFMIFYFLGVNFIFLKLAIFIPLVELMSQFQFIIFGLKELSTVFLLSFLDFDYEISLAGALIYTFTDFVVILVLFLLFNLFVSSKKN